MPWRFGVEDTIVTRLLGGSDRHSGHSLIRRYLLHVLVHNYKLNLKESWVNQSPTVVTPFFYSHWECLKSCGAWAKSFSQWISSIFPLSPAVDNMAETSGDEKSCFQPEIDGPLEVSTKLAARGDDASTIQNTNFALLGLVSFWLVMRGQFFSLANGWMLVSICHRVPMFRQKLRTMINMNIHLSHY